MPDNPSDETTLTSIPVETEKTQIVPIPSETANALVAPVVDVSGKVASLEERHKQQEVDMYRQIGDLEQTMSQRFNERDENFYSKLKELSDRIENMTQKTEESAENTEANTLDIEDVVSKAEETPEEIKRGLRGRKKAKRKTRS